MTGILLALIFLTKPLKKSGFYNPEALVRRWLFLMRYCTGCRIVHPPPPLASPALLVSNHVSWLDILVLGGLYEVHFLSKEEVKKWPVIGFLTVISGTLLIQRGSGSKRAIHDMEHALKAGDNVALFPEGTTTSGAQVNTFHSRLFKAAYNTHANINVMSLSYSSDGLNRDLNMGWEQQSFFEHFFYVLGQKNNNVYVHLVATLDDYQHMPRKVLAQHCQNLIEHDLQQTVFTKNHPNG